jgi:multidrug resistance efflux pump
MDPLPPIPTPVSMYWREFRVRFLPVAVFAGLVFVIVLVWRSAGISSYVAGVAEGVRSTVTSPQMGVIQQLRVRPFQMVQAGEIIAVLFPRDPSAELDLLQTQIAIARLRLEPSVAERSALNFESVRVDLYQLEAELAEAKVNLEGAETEVKRNFKLYKEKLVSEETLALATTLRDRYQAEIKAKTEAIGLIQARLEALSTIGIPQPMTTNDPTQLILNRLELMQASAATNWGPIVLRAPISGMVGILYRQQGENVVEGEPLVSINGNWSDRIVAYVRQPYQVDPMVGMPVYVTTRDRKVREFWSEISQVGAQLETITNTLAFVRAGFLVDAGLPFVVDVPKGVQIRPGETVDLVFRPKPGERVLTPVGPPDAVPGPTGKHAALLEVQ